MEKEIEWMKDKLNRCWPKDAIKDNFIKNFDCTKKGFNIWWERAHKVTEQPKEEKEKSYETNKWQCNRCNIECTITTKIKVKEGHNPIVCPWKKGIFWERIEKKT